MGGDHKCPVCQATFTRPQHVARHMRSHTGDRPYKCTHCGDQFARSDLLSRHINKCHANEKDKFPPQTTGRRKGSSARATTSKQACDQCVQNSLPCDGCNPCAKCIARKIRCTFIKFHRQTAPVGPGHNPSRNGAVPSSALPPPIAMPPRDWGAPFSFPAGPYPADLDDYAVKYRHHRDAIQAMARSAPDSNWVYQPGGVGASEMIGVGSGLSRHPSLGHGPSDFYGYHGDTSSSSSASSSAASSQVHLPLDNFSGPQPSSVGSQDGSGFSSAFGLMSLDDPAVIAGLAADGQPFFEHLSQLPPHQMHPSGVDESLIDQPTHYQYQNLTTPRPSTSSGVARSYDTEGNDLRTFWKEYMRTPVAHPSMGMDQPLPTPHRRARVNSLPSVKTPTENIYGNGRTMHDADDLRSYEAAVLARTKAAPIQLSLNSGLKGRRERAGGSHPTIQRAPPPSLAAAAGQFNDRAASFSGFERPSFKRLASQVLEPGGTKKQRGGSSSEESSAWGDSPEQWDGGFPNDD
ncbi:hypothetical protein CYLTODRAFT_493736 [Cylindrobasidium torrendii FP15055 ss-10]|uniref:Zn(2)-C6 fungal-type domain-containing protein n=1 Tax=Cylindrobasidium torrendii FP15055 ss-10 TaxID=1314674 RepID=A0A0D7AZK1_9AGAR|nr:hypothetical protein CYLTODRAFT_493736 [Cylindrobasidium torrendii FP15055 ss-10]